MCRARMGPPAPLFVVVELRPRESAETPQPPGIELGICLGAGGGAGDRDERQRRAGAVQIRYGGSRYRMARRVRQLATVRSVIRDRSAGLRQDRHIESYRAKE